VFGASKIAATGTTGKQELLRNLGADLAIELAEEQVCFSFNIPKPD